LVSALSLAACDGDTTANAGGADKSDAAGGSGGRDGGGSAGQDGSPAADPFWVGLAREEFVGPVCEDAYWNATAGLNSREPVDYVVAMVGTPPGINTGNFGPEGSSGTACRTASDVERCQAAIDAASLSIPHTQYCGWQIRGYPCQHYLLTTAGDVVKTYLPGAGYLEFLGAIDTPQEALLLAHGQPYLEDEDTYGFCEEQLLVRAVAGGYEVVVTDRTRDCPTAYERVLLQVTREGRITELRRHPVRDAYVTCIGRRHEGWMASPKPQSDGLGAFFAEIAELEAASVPAFWHLHAELRQHGADSALLEETRRAAADEVRHAGVMGDLARKFGGVPRAAHVRPLPLRDLARLACENAVEGCVRETFGALVATYQARHATDVDVAGALAEIAEDETRHAALAFRVAAWLEPKLDDVARETVRAAQQAAIAELRAELGHDVPEALRGVAGMPDAAVAAELLAQLERSLWS
jgi:hypothetical protein